MMIFLGFSLIEQIWSLLAFCFLLSNCIHMYCDANSGQLFRSGVYQFFQDLIRYGKTKSGLKRPAALKVFDVPKKWFYHFYTVSVLWNGLLIYFSLKVIISGEQFPTWLNRTLRLFTNTTGASNNDLKLSAVLVQVLLWVHSLRRLLECLFVSVFSDGVIHLVQYVFGLGYYVLVGFTALCISVPQHREGASVPPFQFQWYHGAGILLFVWASLHQHRCLLLLAQLRTGHSGEVVTLDHKVPSGGWFELVSCPHYLAELLIYVSMGVCAGGSSLCWWLVVLYVLFNQALAAQLSHEFYRRKFDAYPKQRKAFIPFVL